jgi:hypothetical protein
VKDESVGQDYMHSPGQPTVGQRGCQRLSVLPGENVEVIQRVTNTGNHASLREMVIFPSISVPKHGLHYTAKSKQANNW